MPTQPPPALSLRLPGRTFSAHISSYNIYLSGLVRRTWPAGDSKRSGTMHSLGVPSLRFLLHGGFEHQEVRGAEKQTYQRLAVGVLVNSINAMGGVART